MTIITGAQLGAHLRIDDSEDEVQLALAADAACQQVIAWCGRSFEHVANGSESARVFYVDNLLSIVVDDFYTATNLVVKTDDNDDGVYETTWTVTTDFTLQPENALRFGQAWPYYRIISTRNRYFYPSYQNRPTVQVTAAWGWTAVPGAVVNATLIQASRIFKRRTSPEGVIGGFADFGAVRVSTRIDPDVQDLLAPYRRAESFGIA